MGFEGWKEYSLSDLMDIIGGGTPKTTVPEYWGGAIPWLSVKDFGDDNRYVYNTEKTITEEGLKKSSTKLLNKGDLIISARGTVGEIAQLGIDMAFNQSCYGLKANLHTINDFLYYLLKYAVKQLRNNTHGSVFDTITRSTFDNVTVKIPCLEEQKRIANVLSALDNKIELNSEMNKTLEEMAQALFKRWFVDFEFPNEDGEPYKSSGGEFVESELGMIPEGWGISRIEDICEVTSSKRVFLKDYVSEGIPFFRSKEIIEKSKGKHISTELYISNELYNSVKEKYGVPMEGDILLTSVGTLGVPYLVEKESFYFKDGNLIWFKNFNKRGLNLYLYYWLLSNEGKKNIDFITIGSTQKALTISALKNIRVLSPSDDMISSFYKVLKSITSIIQQNTLEISNLTTLRDTLLPKLMSGELRVPEAEQEVEACLQRSN